MSFLDKLTDFGNSAKQATVKFGNSVSGSTGAAMETSRINGEIKQLEQQKEQIFARIGKAIYSAYITRSAAPDTSVDIAQLEGLDREIKTRQDKISAIKSQIVCPVCGARYESDMNFCPKCGTPKPSNEPQPMQYAQPVQQPYGQAAPNQYAQPVQQPYSQAAPNQYAQPVQQPYGQAAPAQYQPAPEAPAAPVTPEAPAAPEAPVAPVEPAAEAPIEPAEVADAPAASAAPAEPVAPAEAVTPAEPTVPEAGEETPQA